MFALTSSCCYYLYRQPTDMRKSFDGLSGIIRNQLKRSPTSGEVFIFINHRRDRIKLLRWEEGGFILYYKRLESGTLELPSVSSTALTCTMTWAHLVMMIEGISVVRTKQRKRFSKFDGFQQNRA
jgi:transposase